MRELVLLTQNVAGRAPDGSNVDRIGRQVLGVATQQHATGQAALNPVLDGPRAGWAQAMLNTFGRDHAQIVAWVT